MAECWSAHGLWQSGVILHPQSAVLNFGRKLEKSALKLTRLKDVASKARFTTDAIRDVEALESVVRERLEALEVSYELNRQLFISLAYLQKGRPAS